MLRDAYGDKTLWAIYKTLNVEKLKRTNTKKSTSAKIKSENHAHHFLRFGWNYPRNLFYKTRLLIETITWERLLAKIDWVWPQYRMWGSQSPLHDNIPAHKYIAMHKFFAFKLVLVPIILHSSDLTLCDYFLVQKLKMKLKGKQFDTIFDIQNSTELRSRPFRSSQTKIFSGVF